MPANGLGLGLQKRKKIVDGFSQIYYLNFDGASGDNVNAGVDSSLSFAPNKPFSVAFLTRIHTAKNQDIITKGTYTGVGGSKYYEYKIYFDASNKFKFKVIERDAATWEWIEIISDASLKYGTTLTDWIFVIVTYDGGTAATALKMYIDNPTSVVSTTGSASGSFANMIDAGGDLIMGIYGANKFDGDLDEVWLFDKVLSQAERLIVYGAEQNLGGDCDPLLIGNGADIGGAKLGLRFEDNGNDSSGTGNTATVNGATYEEY